MRSFVTIFLWFFASQALSREVCDVQENTGLWNRNKIQLEVYEAAKTMQPKVYSSYMTSYLLMTFRRDQQRCGGELDSNSKKQNLIGDYLADIMSRFHVSYSLKCHNDISWNQNTSSFCADFRAIERDNRNSLSAMLMLSSTYLSSHMASSILALIFDDYFWNRYQKLEDGLNDYSDIEMRIQAVTSYKSLFDKNNKFLAQSLVPVVSSLESNCYLRTKRASFATSIAESLPIGKLLFKIIRDTSFKAALNLSRRISPEDHPMLSQFDSDGLYKVNFKKIRQWSSEPAILKKIKFQAELLLHPPGLSVVTKSLGGLNQESYSMLPTCEMMEPVIID